MLIIICLLNQILLKINTSNIYKLKLSLTQMFYICSCNRLFSILKILIVLDPPCLTIDEMRLNLFLTPIIYNED